MKCQSHQINTNKCPLKNSQTKNSMMSLTVAVEQDQFKKAGFRKMKVHAEEKFRCHVVAVKL